MVQRGVSRESCRGSEPGLPKLWFLKPTSSVFESAFSGNLNHWQPCSALRGKGETDIHIYHQHAAEDGDGELMGMP